VVPYIILSIVAFQSQKEKYGKYLSSENLEIAHNGEIIDKI